MGKKKKRRIRPLVICVFRRADTIFVAEGYDPTKQQTFYRPLGGGIKFGEYSRAALIREIDEELGESVADLHYLGTLENIYIFDGKPGHEIVQVYDGRFVNEALYDMPVIKGVEDNPVIGEFDAFWRPLAFFEQDQAILYPDGLLELLLG